MERLDVKQMSRRGEGRGRVATRKIRRHTGQNRDGCWSTLEQPGAGGDSSSREAKRQLNNPPVQVAGRAVTLPACFQKQSWTCPDRRAGVLSFGTSLFQTIECTALGFGNTGEADGQQRASEAPPAEADPSIAREYEYKKRWKRKTTWSSVR